MGAQPARKYNPERIITGTKHCRRCGVVLTKNENWRRSDIGKRWHICKQCRLKQEKIEIIQNKEKRSAQKKIRYWKHADKFRAEARDYRKNNAEICKYAQYKAAAKKRGLEFNLTFLEFMMFWRKPCEYCGSEINTVGIDRINNDEGYSLNNIVSCCDMCNWMKRDYSKDEFIIQCKKIAERFA